MRAEVRPLFALFLLGICQETLKFDVLNTSNNIATYMIHDGNSPLVLFFAFCRQMEFHDDLVPATPRNLEEGKSMT